jgi:hypothetical protein
MRGFDAVHGFRGACQVLDAAGHGSAHHHAHEVFNRKLRVHDASSHGRRHAKRAVGSVLFERAF